MKVLLAIPDFPGYFAPEDGRIWSTNGRILNDKSGRFLKPSLTHGGYQKVDLYRGGKKFNRTVHVLIALAYLGPCPEGMEVRHLDGDQTNNSARNLRYGTKSENAQDRVSHGTDANSRKTHCKRNHEYTPENTGMNGVRKRRCLKCLYIQRKFQKENNGTS